jgi:hypothetical protein
MIVHNPDAMIAGFALVSMKTGEVIKIDNGMRFVSCDGMTQYLSDMQFRPAIDRATRGAKGAHARAEKLSADERSRIAKKAADTRWKNNKKASRARALGG